METERLTLEELTARLTAFRDARNWRQYHSLKNLIVSLNLEAGEVLELTQWKSDEAFEEEVADGAGRDRLAEECADVLLYLLLIAERSGIDLATAAARKIETNAAKYPVEKAYGNSAKYDRL